MENLSNTFKTEQACGSTAPAKLEKIRAGWRPKSGPAASIEPMGRITTAATASPGGRKNIEESAGLDFSAVPQRHLKMARLFADRRLEGNHNVYVGFGIDAQIQRILQNKKLGAGGPVAVPSPKTKDPLDHWRPQTGPLAP